MNKALELGATDKVNAGDPDFIEKIKALSPDGLGVDVAQLDDEAIAADVRRFAGDQTPAILAALDPWRGPERLIDLQLRVGALTRHATNALRYHFTWSVDGVINEYCKPCNTIVNGQPMLVPPLEGVEQLILDGENFEAFNTSGGLGTLCETLQGRVRNLNYKTIRHPGHRDAMHLLLHGLRLIERRDLLRQVLEGAVPHSREDMVVIAAMASGMRAGRLEQLMRGTRIFGAPLRGRQRTAIELTTSAGMLAAVELFATGQLPQQGFVRQEQCTLAALSNTRVASYFDGLLG